MDIAPNVKKNRIIGLLSIFAFIFTVFLANCKKQSTAPDIDNLTRPVIWLNRSDLSFTAYAKGSNPSSQVIKIKNSGQQNLDYTLSSDASWISFSPQSGSSSGQVIEHTISINRVGLEARKEAYTTKIIVTSSQAYNNPQEIGVSLLLTKEPPPKIWVNTKNLVFTAMAGGADPAPQNIEIMNNGEGTLNYAISVAPNWLDVMPLSGTSKTGKKKHAVAVDIGGLKVGTYNGTITVSDPNATNSPQTIDVSLNITKELPPEIWLSKNKLSFQAILGGANPASQSLYIKNSGGGTLKYTVAADAPWLSASPNSGQSSDAEKLLTVSVNTQGMNAGTYNGTITVSDPNASNSPQTVNVILQVSSPLTNNEIGISISPGSGGTGTIVTVPVSIKGNTSPISSFGLDLHFDTSMFQYIDTSKGNLTSSWALVDGNDISGGIIRVGGFQGSGSIVPIGSQGSIVVVRLRVIYNGSSDLSSQITMNNLIDDVSGMTAKPATVAFTYKH